MKIIKFSLTNVTSYKERTEFVFDPRINILIGPNGGGKSNLQKTLGIVLSKYFILQYDFKYDDNNRGIEKVDPWNMRVLERTLEKFFGNSCGQEIELVIEPEKSDIDNIKKIGSNLDAFNKHLNYYEHPFKSYAPFDDMEAIATSQFFTYNIHNLSLQEPEEGSAEWAFKFYLQTFSIFTRLANRMNNIELTVPVFFFFSERSLGKNLKVQGNQITEQNYFSGFRNASHAAMSDNTNLLQWGAQHFARLRSKAVHQAAAVRDKTADDLFELEPDVKLLNRYMEQLGYKWKFQTDQDYVSYAFVLLKDGHWLTVDKFSSGEKEIVHFLLALFALNVKDGVVLIDEPELHLHPRWQRIFLGLFRELAPERNNQFLISTHSPVFVTPDTINNITRIYHRPDTGSARISLSNVNLPNKKNLVRMINSQNNERVFFADKVVLVEGITDRLVLESILDGASAKFSNNEAIEIVEVGGKDSFADYRNLLTALETPSVIFADRDYLTIVGSSSVKSLFHLNSKKQWKVLIKDKKSMDRVTFMAELRSAIESCNCDRLSEFLSYFLARHKKLKEPLTEEELTVINNDLARLEADDIFVLKDGEIEQYLPQGIGISSVKGIIEMTTDRNWINQVPDESRRLELGKIVSKILDLNDLDRQLLKDEFEKGCVKFPQPVSVK